MDVIKKFAIKVKGILLFNPLITALVIFLASAGGVKYAVDYLNSNDSPAGGNQIEDVTYTDDIPRTIDPTFVDRVPYIVSQKE